MYHNYEDYIPKIKDLIQGNNDIQLNQEKILFKDINGGCIFYTVIFSVFIYLIYSFTIYSILGILCLLVLAYFLDQSPKNLIEIDLKKEIIYVKNGDSIIVKYKLNEISKYEVVNFYGIKQKHFYIKIYFNSNEFLKIESNSESANEKVDLLFKFLKYTYNQVKS